MKYKGKEVKGRNREIIPIPRLEGDIIFIAGTVQNWSEFENLVPEPTPPKILKAGGVKIEDKNDPGYLKALDEYNELRTHYLIISSLQATEELEWETVDIQKPETWKNYKKELENSDFSELEIGRIIVGVMRANSLDESMIEEARSNFLREQQGSEK